MRYSSIVLSFRATKEFSPGLEPRIFRDCGLYSLNLPAKAKNFGLDPPSSIVLSLRATKTIFTGTRTHDNFFGIAAFVPAISPPKQTTLVLALFFYHA
jgi:hypothetical protein